jgi:hypothetical protein
MKKLTYTWIFLFLLAACTMPENDAVENTSRLEKSSAEIEKLILEKEKDALNSWAEGSVTGYTKHFADEVTYIDDIGAHNRIDGLPDMRVYAAHLDSIGMISKHRYEFINPRVQVYQDIAILTFQYHPFKPDDTPGTKWKATSVYALIDNDWKVVHGHWSMLKTE